MEEARLTASLFQRLLLLVPNGAPRVWAGFRVHTGRDSSGCADASAGLRICALRCSVLQCA